MLGNVKNMVKYTKICYGMSKICNDCQKYVMVCQKYAMLCQNYVTIKHILQLFGAYFM